MLLNDEQISKYEEDGYVFFPGLIPPKVVEPVMRETRRLFGERRQEVILEKDGKTVRSIMNPHTFSDVFARFVRHPALVEPVQQLVEDRVYIFQSIVNVKHAFTGDVWPWHQDYPTYKADDGMPEPRATNVLVFLEEVSEYNGPLMLVPGSHKEQAYIADLDVSTTSYPGRWMDDRMVELLAREHGIVAPKGPPGSVILAHTNIVHGSGSNMSPWGRTLISLTLNAVSNRHVGARRPDWIVMRDFTPVEPLGVLEPTTS